jgi:hypothetical protein
MAAIIGDAHGGGQRINVSRGWLPPRENHFCTVAGGAYDPGVVTGSPAWREVRLLVARELGERLYDARPLVPARRSGMTWAARAHRTGPIVVKARHGWPASAPVITPRQTACWAGDLGGW